MGPYLPTPMPRGCVVRLNASHLYMAGFRTPKPWYLSYRNNYIPSGQKEGEGVKWNDYSKCMSLFNFLQAYFYNFASGKWFKAPKLRHGSPVNFMQCERVGDTVLVIYNRYFSSYRPTYFELFNWKTLKWSKGEYMNE